jgi:hypothetical protein
VAALALYIIIVWWWCVPRVECFAKRRRKICEERKEHMRRSALRKDEMFVALAKTSLGSPLPAWAWLALSQDRDVPRCQRLN